MPQYDFARFLNVRNAYAPSPSPDGSAAAFLYDVTGVPQAWLVSSGDAWPRQLTFFGERVSLAEFAPAGGRLAFAMDLGGSEEHKLYSLALSDGTVTPLADDDGVIHNWGRWSPDGRAAAFSSNARDRRFFDIYTQTPGGARDRVLEQDGTNSVADWGGGGRYLVVSRANSNLDNDLYLLDLESREVRHLTPHDGEAVFAAAALQDDGSILLISNRDREFMGLARLDTRDLTLEYIAEAGWDVEDLAATRDGRVLAYAVNEDGYSHVYLRRDGRNVELRGVPSGVAAGLRFSEDGSTLMFTLYGPTRNGDAWAVDTESGEARQLTFAGRAGIAEEALVEPELVRFRSFDGLEIPAFLYLPRDSAKPLPVVLHVHGGPEAQARPVFNPTIQFLVHRGIAVLQTNVRGSTGYGKTYTHLDDVRKRMDSVADLQAAAEWLVASGTASKYRIAVMGGSYGGFMTLAALTSYPDTWAAGVDTVGIANFVTFLENTGPWRRKLREVEYGSLEADREFLEEISPINHVDRIKAPLLVIHGANDPRVPVGEAEQIVEKLRARGQPVEYLRYEDEGHGIVKLRNRISSSERIAAFLEKQLRLA